ncbi:DUF4397 domain-containing protein [Kineococcus sp. NUM-3379]
MRTTLAAAAAAALPLLLAAAPASAAGSGDASVTVLHAVPGLTVDVYANGQEVAGDFRPGTSAGPLSLPAGSYDLAVFPAGADPATAQPAVSADDVAVPAGATITVAAHLSASGQPTLTPFVEDTSAVPAGQAGLTVRHVAAAPAVDVRAGGQPVLPGLENPREASATVPAGTVSADVVLAGTDQVAIGPADLTLAEGTRTVVYAWGSAQDGNLALLTRTVDGVGSAPTGVPAGEGGLADGPVGWTTAAGVLLLAGAAVAAGRARASRVRA